MEKVYIASCTNSALGYDDLEEIVDVFSSEEKAISFLKRKREKLMRLIKNGSMTIMTDMDNDKYFFAKDEKSGYWIEISIIEKELK